MRRDPTSRDYVSPPLPEGEVVIHRGRGEPLRVRVEIAATDASITRGLMWRTELEEGRGMLFVFGVTRIHAFWMRNTLIPLDMLFIDDAGVIVGIVADAPPGSTVLRHVGRPSRLVLECPGGWSGRNGVGPGARIELLLSSVG